MENIKNTTNVKHSKKFLMILFSSLLILTLSIILIPNNKSDLEIFIENFKEELVENEGNYSLQQIVLENTTETEAEEIAERLNAKLRITKDGSFAALTLPDGVTIKDIVNDKNNEDIVEKFSIDYQATISELEEIEEKFVTKPSKYTPNDEYYSKQSYFDYLNLSNVWSSYKGDGITVAVIDTGIDTDHPEFEGKISEYSYNATEDKIVKDYLLEDGTYDWSIVEDIQGHGTAVTGVIAAGMDNTIGITGIAPNVEIITIKVECDEQGNFYKTSDLVFGLYYAIERDVDVVNMSFGGNGNSYDEATRLAVDSDIICVAAAGNDGTASLTYPAADPNVIGVGALAEDSWELASYSNFGENVDLVAPGTVYTTKKNGEYGIMNGTSFASPIVAGILALLSNKEGYSTFEYVQELLYASSVDMGDLGADFYFGYGCIDTSALILEERKTVTFNYLTDEIEPTEQIFIKGHTLQNIPEPERNYAVFDGWYYDIHCFEEYNLYEDIWTTDLTLYCNWVNEDDGLPYTYVELDDGTIEIRSYTGKRRYITIPEYIDNKVVSSIGAGAFQNETRLRVINLPKQLKHIKDGAFANCINIISMTIPSSVESIGAFTFSNNIRLYNLNLEAISSLKTIGSSAFEDCSSLVRIDLPKTLEKVDGSTFVGCTNLKQISVDKKNKNFISSNGVLYNKSKTTLIAYPAGLSESTYDLPSTVKTLGIYSFAFSKIETIDLKNVTSIADGTFMASSICTIDISDKVTYLGAESFASSNIRNITLGHGITKIPDGCFNRTSFLKEITIPNTIKEIGSVSFSFSDIMKISFEEKSELEFIGLSSFSKTSIYSIDIPDSVLYIADSAFSESTLSQIHINNNSNLTYIGKNAFSGTFIEEFNFPKNLHTIGDFSFEGTYLTEVNLPTSLHNYSPSAFASCFYLENIYVDDNNELYTDIEGVVYTKDLKMIHEYPAGRQVYEYTILDNVVEVEEYAFYGSYNLEYVYLPETLELIGRESFARNISLRSITIPDSVTQISNYAFKNNYNMNYVNISDNAKLQRLSYGTFSYCGITSFRIPANISTISQDVFIGCPNLYSVTFAASSKLESVSAYLFNGCENLQTITFESGSALTNIQSHAFEGISNLKTIDFGDAKITNIDNFAFRYCENLQYITIPDTVEYIGRYSFYGCKSLSRIDIPESVEYIGQYAFNVTNDLDVYFLSNSLPLYIQENWDYGIRGYYVGVKEVYTEGDYKFATLNNDTTAIIEYNGAATNIDLTTLNKMITQIGGSAFKGSSIESIVLPNALKTIEKSAFGNTKLKSITIPSNVEYLGDNAFQSSEIESVTFESNKNLTKIGMYVFENTYNLKEITLPKSLTSLGSYAFLGSGLEKVIFEEGIKLSTINEGAFQKTKLKKVVIPELVTLINHNAFRDIETLQQVKFNDQKLEIMSNVFYNTDLTSVNIPANLKYIGEYAFVGLKNLTAFNVDANNKYYTSIDGVLYSKDGRKLIAYPAGKEGTFEVPKNVEVLGFGAFENSKLISVTFEEGINLLTLGYRVFYNASIRSIEIPESVISIDYYAFAMNKYLESVKFSKNNKLGGIYEGAFNGCINLTDITIPDNIYEISDYAFFGCLKLEKLPITENSKLLGIYDYAFANSGLKEVNLLGTLLDIGNYAFQGIDATEIVVPSDNQEQLIIGFGAFADTNSLEQITLPFIGASLNNEENSWFGYIFGAGSYKANATYIPKSLKNVVISEGISFIDQWAFYEIRTIDSIHLPDTLESVGDNAFFGTSFSYSLKNLKEIFKYDIYGNKIILNELYNNFGTGIIEFKLPINIIKSNLTAANLQSLYYDGDIKQWLEIDFECGLINENTKFYILNNSGKYSELEEVIIPNNITSIGDYQFYNLTSLKSVIFEGNVTNIGNCSFRNCINLTSLFMPNTLTNIGTRAFEDCINLEEINFSDLSKLSSLGASAFEDCISLEEVNFSDLSKLSSLGEGAFLNCSSLKQIKIPQNVTNIDMYAFKNCINLEQVIFIENSKLETIGYEAFADCISLETIKLPNSIISTGTWSFKNCSKLNTVNFGDNCKLQEIGDYTFQGCSSLVNIILPENLKTISTGAFQECSGLLKINIPKNVEHIESLTFNNCVNLNEISFHSENQLKEIGQYAFNMCENLLQIEMPNTVTYIGSYAFSNCTKMSKIIIPDSVTVIESNAFAHCNNLTSINVPKDISNIGSNAFYDCVNLFEVFNNSNLTIMPESYDYGYIGYYALIVHNNDGTKHFWNDCEDIEIIVNDDFVFTKSYGSYSLRGYLGNEETVVLPTDINGFNYSVRLNNTTIKSLIIPNSFTNLTGSFIYCTNLTSVIISENTNVISDNIFGDNIKEITCSFDLYVNSNYLKNLTNSVKFNFNSYSDNYIKNGVYLYDKMGELLFALPQENEQIIIPKEMNVFEKNVFALCRGENIYYSGTLEDWCKVVIVEPEYNPMFYAERFYVLNENLEYYELDSIRLLETMPQIGAYQFYGLNCLKELEIAQNTNYNAFENCSNLEKVTFRGASNEIIIRSMTFANCESLKEVIFEDNCQVIEIEHSAFYNCVSLENINLPINVTNLGDSVFSGCENLFSIELYQNIRNIGNSSFSGCEKLTNVYYNGTIEDWCNIKFNYHFSNPMCYAERFYIIGENDEYEELKEVIIPETISNIGDYQFYSFDNIINVTIPNTIVSIGEGAFSYCNNLISVDISQGLETILWYAFSNCIKIENIDIPSSVKTICSYAFSDCTNLKGVTFEENSQLTSIESSLFKNCTSLVNIIIPKSVNNIGSYAFDNCKNLETIIFEENSQLEGIGSHSFNMCFKLVEINLPNKLNNLGSYAFRLCNNLKDVYIPNSLKLSSSESFVMNSNLTNVYYTGTIEEWCNISFETIYSNPMTYAKHFYMLDENNEYYELKEIIIPDTITIIGKYQFSSFDNIVKLFIPKTINTIGKQAFSSCKSLIDIVFEEGSSLTQIEASAFNSCINLLDIEIPENVKTINTGAFSGCENLYEIRNNSNINIIINSSSNGNVGKYAKIIYNKDGSKTYRENNIDIYEKDGFKFIYEYEQYILYAYAYT